MEVNAGSIGPKAKSSMRGLKAKDHEIEAREVDCEGVHLVDNMPHVTLLSRSSWGSQPHFD